MPEPGPHVCPVARRRWPGATFDGLDLSASVEEARRRGRIDTAYRGAFPELAGGLPRSYDVVTMHPAPALATAAVPDLIMDRRLRRPVTEAPGNALRVVARRG